MSDYESKLKSGIERDELWANASAWLIVVGIAIEIVQAWLAHLFSSVVPDVLVGLGVAGELLFTRSAFIKQSQLNAITDERIATANVRAAEALKAAESERLARIKIEARLAARELTAEQEERVAQHLSKWAVLPGTDKRQSVAVFPTAPLFESAWLADRIASALSKAGWDVNRNAVTFGKSLGVRGVGVLTSRNSRALEVMASLVQVLNAEGILTHWIHEPRDGCEEMGRSPEEITADPWCSQLSIFVGERP